MTQDHEPDVPVAMPPVHNGVTVSAAGAVVQAGMVAGDIHNHVASSTLPKPRQLPPAPVSFTGRATELAVLASLIQHHSNVPMSLICGIGGIGKTALAMHWAHQYADQFPDGQLYVNLRGFDPSGCPTPAGVALRGFLSALGMAQDFIPIELEQQAALYRSLLTDKRVLIVLDNARDAVQVLPLLPGSPTCMVLVTSRHRLVSLTTIHGACVLDLDTLTESESWQLLARRVGSYRLLTENPAAAQLLAVCAGLPLALQIVAARIEHHFEFPLTILADELNEATARLDGLDAGDLHTNLRAVLSWSYSALGSHAARLFCLLGLMPYPEGGLPDIAALAALTTAPTRKVLRQLENASLVQQHEPGRYRLHDLVYLHAGEQAERDLPIVIKNAAMRRLIDFYKRADEISLLTIWQRTPGQGNPGVSGGERLHSDGRAR